MSSLTEWLQTTLTNNFFQVDPETNNTDDVAFSPDAQIFWNHELISVDEYKRRTVSGQFTKGSQIEWKDTFEVPDPQTEGNGIVAGYLVATHYSKFKIRAAPAQSQSKIVLSAKIEKDQNDDDNRKIVHLFHTTVDKAVPVHFHTVPTDD